MMNFVKIRLFRLLMIIAPLAAFAPLPSPAHEYSGRIFISLPRNADLSDKIAVDIFRPACKPRGVIALFVGYRRNSADYRDYAKPLARAACLLIFAPHFSAKAFPPAAYQRADYAHSNALNAAAPLLKTIKTRAAHRSGEGNLPLILIGHSAGAQYLDRLIAYQPLETAPRGYILISAGTYAMPSAAIAPPYGFKGVNPAALRAYLGAPVRILIGGRDISNAAHLSQVPEAKAQGANRLARARNFWAMGQAEAAKRKAPFGWTLQIISNIGHSPAKALQSAILRQTIENMLSKDR